MLSLAEESLTKKAGHERKRLQNIYIFVGLTAGSQNVTESVCVVSGSYNVRERECVSQEVKMWESVLSLWVEIEKRVLIL